MESYDLKGEDIKICFYAADKMNVGENLTVFVTDYFNTTQTTFNDDYGK